MFLHIILWTIRKKYKINIKIKKYLYIKKEYKKRSDKMKKNVHDYFPEFLNNPTSENFKKMIRDNTGESNYLEFKEDYPIDYKLAKTILGMANSGGGIIIIGIDDNRELKGLKELKDKTDIGNKLSNYLPKNLIYDIHDIKYDEKEKDDNLKDKQFQLIIIDDTPDRIPFLSLKEEKNNDETVLYNTIIYCRKNTSTTQSNQEDIQEIMERRVNSKVQIGVNEFKEDLEQLKLLYVYMNSHPPLFFPSFNKKLKEFLNKKIETIEDKL